MVACCWWVLESFSHVEDGGLLLVGFREIQSRWGYATLCLSIYFGISFVSFVYCRLVVWVFKPYCFDGVDLFYLVLQPCSSDPCLRSFTNDLVLWCWFIWGLVMRSCGCCRLQGSDVMCRIDILLLVFNWLFLDLIAGIRHCFVYLAAMDHGMLEFILLRRFRGWWFAHVKLLSFVLVFWSWIYYSDEGTLYGHDMLVLWIIGDFLDWGIGSWCPWNWLFGPIIGLVVSWRIRMIWVCVRLHVILYGILHGS